MLTVDIVAETEWLGVTWERLLGSFSKSERPWVAETARAWLAHLDRTMPRINAQTSWNDMRVGENFVIALRARMSWVFGQLRPPEPITHDLVISSAGRSPVARMYLPAAVPGYRVMVEAEERLSVREYPGQVTKPNSVLGPSIKVCLLQSDVDTSDAFDWDYLLALWPLMAAVREDWIREPPRLRAPHDKVNWRAMVARGGPRYLGIGFGDAQAKRTRECMFGARFQLPRDVRLLDVVDALHQSAALMLDMAAADQGNVKMTACVDHDVK